MSENDHGTQIGHHQIDELIDLEERIARLRDRQAELEVERIDAGICQPPGGEADGRGIDGETAADVIEALDRVRGCEGGGSGAQPSERERRLHRAAVESLEEWLDIGKAPPRNRTLRWSEVAVAAAFIAIVGAAYFLHLAFLVVLLPLSAMSRVMWSGDDSQWLRIAARRRFEQTGFDPPNGWTEEAVTTRLGSIRGAMPAAPAAAADPQDGKTIDEADHERLNSQLAATLSACGLIGEQLDPALEATLRILARSHLIERELERGGGRLKTLRDEEEAIRSTIYTYLRNSGLDLGGKTDSESLRSGLAKLAASSDD